MNKKGLVSKGLPFDTKAQRILKKGRITMSCRKCGNEVDATADFCAECGTAITKEGVPPNIPPGSYPPSHAPSHEKTVGFAVASMVLGIVSIVLLCVWPIPIITAIVGLVLGAVSLKKNLGGRGMAIAGVVMSVIVIAIAIAIAIYVAYWVAVFDEWINSLSPFF